MKKRLKALRDNISSRYETWKILRDERAMEALAQAERDIAAGRVIEYRNWGCG